MPSGASYFCLSTLMPLVYWHSSSSYLCRSPNVCSTSSPLSVFRAGRRRRTSREDNFCIKEVRCLGTWCHLFPPHVSHLIHERIPLALPQNIARIATTFTGSTAASLTQAITISPLAHGGALT